MNSNGIEIQGLNFMPALQQKELEKDRPVIKPVKKSSKGTFRADADKGNHSRHSNESGSAKDINEDDARHAAHMMNELLRDKPELESSLEHDTEEDKLLVIVRNRASGKIIRKVSPAEILASGNISHVKTSGKIIKKTA